MSRILFALAIAFALVWWFRRNKGTNNKNKPPLVNPQSLIQCAHCGVMVPESESFFDPQQRGFCSAEHLSLANHTNSQKPDV